MFDCDGAELNYIDEASDDESESDGESESDDESNDQAEQSTSPENNQPPTTPGEPPAPVILVDLYEGSPELKKDAAFLDTLDTLLANLKYQTNFSFFSE